MQDVYKKKGDPMITDSSRGILFADHAGKGLIGMVKEKIDPAYEKMMPATQFGAVSKRGTDQASHIVRSAADAAAMRNFNIVVFFSTSSKLSTGSFEIWYSDGGQSLPLTKPLF